MARIVFALLWGLILFQARGQQAKVTTGKEIMIVAHPLAARAGLSVFEKGGNVVDVAVATAYALGVVEPHGSGLGGEGMMLIYDASTGSSTVVDFKAIAPRGATYGTLDYKNIASWARTIRGASVPGAVAGLELARERFGKLDRKSDLAPAIELALKGFAVDSTLASLLKRGQPMLMKDPYLARTFYRQQTAPVAGAVLTNPDYAKSLQEIQADGARAFYSGKIAELIVRDALNNGGLITMEDLRAYRPVVRQALHGHYRDVEIITTPPPCGGMHLIEALNILSFFDLEALRKEQEYPLHLMAETFKLVFKDERTHNADPAFVAVPVDEVTSRDFAFQRLLEINLGRAREPEMVKPGIISPRHTTHLSVMDAQGNAVALTITLSSLFGTTHTVEGAGFLLNNEMQNFDPDSTAANGLAPHKRVVTSLVPTLLRRDGRPVYVLGLPGGDAIISTLTQVIVNLIDYRMDLAAAIAAPRIFTIASQTELEIERGYPEETLNMLRAMGHEVAVRQRSAYFGVLQAVWRDESTGVLTGVSDVRRSGAAVGK